MSVSALSLSGNLFHKIGAADANARSPYTFVQVDEDGTTSKCLLLFKKTTEYSLSICIILCAFYNLHYRVCIITKHGFWHRTLRFKNISRDTYSGRLMGWIWLFLILESNNGTLENSHQTAFSPKCIWLRTFGLTWWKGYKFKQRTCLTPSLYPFHKKHPQLFA